MTSGAKRKRDAVKAFFEAHADDPEIANVAQLAMEVGHEYRRRVPLSAEAQQHAQVARDAIVKLCRWLGFNSSELAIQQSVAMCIVLDKRDRVDGDRVDGADESWCRRAAHRLASDGWRSLGLFLAGSSDNNMLQCQYGHLGVSKTTARALSDWCDGQARDLSVIDAAYLVEACTKPYQVMTHSRDVLLASQAIKTLREGTWVATPWGRELHRRRCIIDAAKRIAEKARGRPKR